MERKEEKSCFGVEQLDNITLGTMSPGSMGLFHGPAGTGKSSMLYHFLFQGARMDENVCLITSEPPGRIADRISVFKTHQAKWLKDGYITIFNIQDLSDLIGVRLEDAGSDDVDLLFDLILQVVEHLDAKRLVLDPINPLLHLIRLWDKTFFFQRLKGALLEKRISTFIALDTNSPLGEMDLDCMEPLNFDVLVSFRREEDPPTMMNTMTIERWKGIPHARNTYVMDISEEGIILVPRIKPLEVR